MSDESPTTPLPNVDGPAATAAAGAASGGGGGKKIALGAAGIVAVAAVGGGAWAWTQLSGGGTQPHDVLPDDTIVYARVDLDPSASQKIDLFRLAKRVPDLANELGIKDEDADLRQLVIEDVLGDCADYDKDVKPWLGERIGLGLGPGAEASEPDVHIAVQVKDEKKATTGIAKLFQCGGEEHGIAFLDGYAIVTPDQKSADAAVKDAEKSSLADTDQFADDMDALDEDGIVSGWVNVKKASEVAADAGLEEELGDIQSITDEAATAAFALSASSTSLHLDAIASPGENPTEVPDVRGLGDLPKDTIVGLSLVGAGKGVEENWDELKSGLEDILSIGGMFGMLPGTSFGPSTGFPEAETPDFDVPNFDGPDIEVPDIDDFNANYALDDDEVPQVDPPDPFDEDDFEDFLDDPDSFPEPRYGSGPSADGLIAQVEQALDVTLPEDLVTLLGESFTFYVGSEGLEDAAKNGGPEDPSELNVGIAIEGDTAKASDLAKRLIATAERQLGATFVMDESDDIVALSTNKDTAAALIDDGDLSSNDAYKSVIDDDAEAGGLFIDIGTILDTIEASEPDIADDEVFQGFRILDAVGASSTQLDDGYSGFSLAIAFTDQD